MDGQIDDGFHPLHIALGRSGIGAMDLRPAERFMLGAVLGDPAAGLPRLCELVGQAADREV